MQKLRKRFPAIVALAGVEQGRCKFECAYRHDMSEVEAILQITSFANAFFEIS
jgi:hypothetical protein